MALPVASAPPLWPKQEVVARGGKQPGDAWEKLPGESPASQGSLTAAPASVPPGRSWGERKGALLSLARRRDCCHAVVCHRYGTCLQQTPKWNRCFRYYWTHRRKAPRKSKRYGAWTGQRGLNPHSSWLPRCPPCRLKLAPGAPLGPVDLACCVARVTSHGWLTEPGGSSDGLGPDCEPRGGALLARPCQELRPQR